jgi:hypothetical protein
MVEWMDMFIRVQFRDFEITSGKPPIEEEDDRICYWATIYGDRIRDTVYLSTEGNLDKMFYERLHRFYSLEEIEAALSIYYKSPIKLDIIITRKELV